MKNKTLTYLFKRWLFFLLASSLALISCSSATKEEHQTTRERTELFSPYDLNIYSPENALKEFLLSYQKGDFDRVYILFSRSLQQKFDLLDYQSFLGEYSADIGNQKELNNANYFDNQALFDWYLWTAYQQDKLLLSFPQNYEVIEKSEYQMNQIEQTTLLSVQFEGWEEIVVFQLKSNQLGLWRIHSIYLDGFSPNGVIIDLKLSNKPGYFAIAAENRTYYDILDLSTPEKSISLFIDSWETKHFITNYLVLSPQIQFDLYQFNQILEYKVFLNPNSLDNSVKAYFENNISMLDFEKTDFRFSYDRLMQIAAEEHALWFNFESAEHEIIFSERGIIDKNRSFQDYIVSTSNQTFRFRMVQATDDSWRVEEIEFIDEGIIWPNFK